MRFLLIPLVALFANQATPPSPSEEPKEPSVQSTSEVSEASRVSYWERKRVVYLRAQCGSNGIVDSVEVFDNNSTQAEADSLVALVGTWTFPPPKWAEGRRFPIWVAVATDRRESKGNYANHPRLNSAVKRLLEEGELQPWTNVWIETDPAFSTDDFTLVSVGRILHRPGFPNYELMKAKRRLGLLHASPDRRWLLDPFAGIYAKRDSTLSPDIDTGYALLDPETGERVAYSVSASSGMTHGVWLDSSRFVLVGSSRVMHPKSRKDVWLDFSVPTVWVGDIEADSIYRYQGAPISPLSRDKVSVLIREYEARTYPLVKRR